MSLHLGLSMEMKYPFQPIRCVWCFPYCNLKEPIKLRISNSLASLNSIRQLELKSVATVRSLYNVFENHSTRQVNPSLFDKVTEADRKIKEDERRRKIGLANRGNVPWNKGKKHSEDTRRRIKQRTIEALRNPKVKSSSKEDV